MPILDVSRNRTLFRLTGARHPDPAYFGRRMISRFDAPDGSFSVCYLGTSLDCCFLEVFSPERDPHTGHLFITATQLGEHYAAVARTIRPLRLAYLADDSLAGLGVDQRLTGGDDYRLSRRWAQAIHAHAGMVDGIFYATRHHNQLYAVALFERARDAVEFRRWGTLGDRSIGDLWVEMDRILQRFGIAMLQDA